MLTRMSGVGRAVSAMSRQAARPGVRISALPHVPHREMSISSSRSLVRNGIEEIRGLLQSNAGDEKPGKKDGRNKGKGGSDEPPPPPPQPTGRDLLWLLVYAGGAMGIAYAVSGPARSKEITWEEFNAQLLSRGLVERLYVNGKKTVHVVLVPNATVYSGEPGGVSNGTQYYFNIGSVDSFEQKMTDTQNALGIPLKERIPISYTDSFNVQGWISTLTSLAITGFLFFSVRSFLPFFSGRMRGPGAGGGGMPGGGLFGGNPMGQKPKFYALEENIPTRFVDVAGMDEAKEEVLEVVDFMKDSARYTRLGAKIPKGCLLWGEPGTGKTLLAKAVAGEAGVPFYSVSGSDFMEMYVGVGASRVRELFAAARENAPSIIFVDEIDAIGRKRQRSSSGGHDERDSTLNQLLVEMDGFKSDSEVVVLAGTNRKELLDDALTRPGRFDRAINVPKPDALGRRQIFSIYLEKLLLEHKKTPPQDPSNPAKTPHPATPPPGGPGGLGAKVEPVVPAENRFQKPPMHQHQQQPAFVGPSTPDVAPVEGDKHGAHDQGIMRYSEEAPPADSPSQQQQQPQQPQHPRRRSQFKSMYTLTSPDVDPETLLGHLATKFAAMTPGFSGAEIANVCNEAAIIAARLRSDIVTEEHLDMAMERVIAGPERKSRVLSPEEKRTVAYHEAGHAICGWFLEHCDPLIKVTIIPHGEGTLGYAQYLPRDVELRTREHIFQRMMMALGGRVSEEVNFGRITNGAANDLQQVTRYAALVVEKYGMTDDAGLLVYGRSQDDYQRSYSEHSLSILDKATANLVKAAHDACRALLEEKKAELTKVAEFLLDVEVMSRQDMAGLLGPPPHKVAEYDDVLSKFKTFRPTNAPEPEAVAGARE